MKFLFDLTRNYHAEFSSYVDEVHNLPDIYDQEQRHNIVDSLLESYVEQVGDRPPETSLDKLTQFYMRDYYKDMRPNKLKEENAFLTERMIKDRTSHEKGDHLLDTYSNDKQNHMLPTRDNRRKLREDTSDDSMSVAVRSYNQSDYID